MFFEKNEYYYKLQKFIENKDNIKCVEEIDHYIRQKLDLKVDGFENVITNGNNENDKLKKQEPLFKEFFLKYIIDFDRVDRKKVQFNKSLEEEMAFIGLVNASIKKDVKAFGTGLSAINKLNENEKTTILQIILKLAHENEYFEGVTNILKKFSSDPQKPILVRIAGLKSKSYACLLAEQGIHKLFELIKPEQQSVDNIAKMFKYCLKSYNYLKNRKCRKDKTDNFASDHDKVIKMIIDTKCFESVVREQSPMNEAIKYDVDEAVFRLIEKFGLSSKFVSQMNKKHLNDFLDKTIKEVRECTKTILSVNYHFLDSDKTSNQNSIRRTDPG